MKSRAFLFISTLFVCAVVSAQEDVGIFPALQNGRIANPTDYPASIWIGNCSAAVVGERVVQTASHCVRNGGTIRFSVLSSQYTAKCEHHPRYRNNSTADWAYCKVDKVVAGIPYEVIETDLGALKVGMMLTLSGYGCQYWGGPLDGKYRVGESNVTRVPSDTTTNYDIVTDGKAAVCSGDSGGPAFLVKADGVRTVVTANSRRNTSRLDSFLPFTAVPTNVAFMKDWATRNTVEICGVHVAAKGCRKVGPPPVPTDFMMEGQTVSLVGKLKPSAKYTVEEAKAEFQIVIDRLDFKN